MHLARSTRLLISLLILLPAAAWPAPRDQALRLRYRVRPGQLFVHDLALQVRARVQASPGLTPPPALSDGLNQTLRARIVTAVIRQRADGSHEALQSIRLQLAAKDRAVDLPEVGPLPYLITAREFRSLQETSATAGLSGLALLGEHSSLMDALPEQALRPGDTWRQQLRSRMPDGSPLTLSVICRYVGQEVVEGDPCARVAVRATMPRLVLKESGLSGSATLTVNGTQLCSLATGMPRRASGTVGLAMTFRGPGGKQARIAAEIGIRLRQVAATQREQLLARQWSGTAGTAVAAAPPTRRQVSRPTTTGSKTAAASLTARPAAATSGGSAAKPVAIIEPKHGAVVPGKCTLRVMVPEESEAAFVVLLIDGTRVAAMNARPFRYEVPDELLRAGEHTLVAEVYGGTQVPLARTSVRVRVP